MPIYKGSTKLGTIYHGGTKIGKVYKGSTLVYSGAKNIPIYYIGGFDGGNFYSFGYPIANSKLVVEFVDEQITPTYMSKITKITGVLGATGSVLTVNYPNVGSLDLPFISSFTDSYGNIFYKYGILGYIPRYAFVCPKAVIGDDAITGSSDYGLVSSDGKTMTYYLDKLPKSFTMTTPTLAGTYSYKQ